LNVAFGGKPKAVLKPELPKPPVQPLPGFWKGVGEFQPKSGAVVGMNWPVAVLKKPGMKPGKGEPNVLKALKLEDGTKPVNPLKFPLAAVGLNPTENGVANPFAKGVPKKFVG
jgi:hypothetical protein